MKKLLILGLVFSVMSIFGSYNIANADEESDAVIKDAIEKYKNKNYVGCISDLRMEIERNPMDAVAWYYLGNSYMNIAMKPEAHEAFDQVVMINTVPKLTSYAIQAKLCMENSQKCDYQEFSNDEIKQLKANPVAFLDSYFANLNKKEEKSAQDIEIEKLINNGYGSKIHPDASSIIMQERSRMDNVRSRSKAHIPSEDRISEALNLNTDISTMAMIIENSQTRENHSDFSPEMVKLLMMQQ